MLIDRKNIPWAVVTLILAALAVGVYLWDAPRHVQGPSGSTAVGLTLGIAAFLIMLFAAALGLKRRVPHWRLGRAQTWLRGHVWLGLLAPLLVALHGAFAAGGTLTLSLWVLLAIVTASGTFGLILQQLLPTMLLNHVPGETVAQQIDRELRGLPALAEDIVYAFDGGTDTALHAARKKKADPPAWMVDSGGAAESAEGTVAAAPVTPAVIRAEIESRVLDLRKKREPHPIKGATSLDRFAPFFAEGSPALREFSQTQVLPYLRGAARHPLANPGAAAVAFEKLRLGLDKRFHPGVDALADLCERRRQLQRQKRTQCLLVAWLIVHVPVSWLLLLLAAVHAVVALRWG